MPKFACSLAANHPCVSLSKRGMYAACNFCGTRTGKRRCAVVLLRVCGLHSFYRHSTLSMLTHLPQNRVCKNSGICVLGVPAHLYRGQSGFLDFPVALQECLMHLQMSLGAAYCAGKLKVVASCLSGILSWSNPDRFLRNPRIPWNTINERLSVKVSNIRDSWGMQQRITGCLWEGGSGPSCTIGQVSR